MRSLPAAVRFLTIIPLPAPEENEGERLRGALGWFPIVGLLIGLFAATVDIAVSRGFPPPLASAFVVIVLVAISGGLHLDGLADTADGLFSSQPREKTLAIMRDSSTGPMGVIAIVSVLMLKVYALSSVAPDLRWGTIILMPLAGRCALVILLVVLPYARQEGGVATIFRQSAKPNHAVWAVGLLAVVGWIVASWVGMLMTVVSIVSILLFAWYTFSKIGGFTGDTLGAGCEIVELLPALVAAASSYGG